MIQVTMAVISLDTSYIPTVWGALRVLVSAAVVGAALGVGQALEQ